MKYHLREVEGYVGRENELIENIINQRYDKVAEYFWKFALKFQKDSDADYLRDRPKLAKELYAVYEKLLEVRDHIEEAWRISKPYMINLEEE